MMIIHSWMRSWKDWRKPTQPLNSMRSDADGCGSWAVERKARNLDHTLFLACKPQVDCFVLFSVLLRTLDEFKTCLNDVLPFFNISNMLYFIFF